MSVELDRSYRGTNLGLGCLTRILGPKRDEVRGEWRKLYNEGLKDLYSSPKNCVDDKIEKNEMGGA